MTTSNCILPEILPDHIRFSTSDNGRLREYIVKAFLITSVITEEDLRKGYIEISNTKYAMYLERDAYFARDLLKQYHCLISCQTHTNGATVAVCKLLLPKEFNTNHKRYTFLKLQMRNCNKQSMITNAKNSIAKLFTK